MQPDTRWIRAALTRSTQHRTTPSPAVARKLRAKAHAAGIDGKSLTDWLGVHYPGQHGMQLCDAFECVAHALLKQ